MAKSLNINFGSGGGGGSNPPNLLITATDATGTIIDGTSNVIQRTLTGYTAGANTALAASDTILGAFQKVQGQLNGKINNQTAVQTGAVYSVVRGIITQASGGTSATQFPTNQVDVLTVTGGKGTSSTFSGTTAQGAKGGQINLTAGAGGDISVATGGAAGAGGQVRFLAGTGGAASVAGQTAGQGGVAELQAGDAGVASGGATVAQPGYASVKAGNAAITGNGNGGDVFIIGGMRNGTGTNGNIYLGTGPGGSFANARGNVTIGGDTGFPPTRKLEVNGDIFVATATTPATPTGGGVLYVAADTDLHYISSTGLNTNITGHVGGQTPFTADGTTTVIDIVHNLGAIPSYWTLTTSEPITSNHLNRTISFPDVNTMRITFNLAPNLGEDANYVWIVYK